MTLHDWLYLALILDGCLGAGAVLVYAIRRRRPR